SGTPNTAGSFNFSITATDTNGCTGTRSYTVAINTPPTISGATLSAQQGSPAATQQIATANDVEDAETALTLAVTPLTGTGVTIGTPAVDASGNVTASVQAACAASNSTFQVKVTDTNGALATATLTVNVTANSAPTVGTYA